MCTGGPWPDKLRSFNPLIEELETRAVYEGISFVADWTFQEGNITDLFLFIDNTTTLASVRRGYARRFWTNAAVEEVERRLAYSSLRLVSLEYISSENNPADFWSRLDLV